MALPEDALEILLRAEGELRQLIDRALSHKAYPQVALLAGIADRQASLIADVREEYGRPSTHVESSVEKHGTRVTGDRAGRRSAGTSTYPRFHRDGNKLVKVGWSKKDGRTYEHRAPVSAVLTFARAVTRAVAKRGTFDMDAILPLRGPQHEVPTYQAYLALAWLRSIGFIKRDGKNTYSVEKGFGVQSVEREWDGLAARHGDAE